MDGDYWVRRASFMSEAHVEHQQRVFAEFSELLSLIDKGLFALGFSLDHEMPRPWSTTFANELASISCFGRAFSELKAATALAASGYYAEVEVLLRAAYEAASLGKMLAKEPDEADRWLRKNEWFPQSKVQAWIESVHGDSARDLPFKAHYRHASSATHPTARASMRSVDFDADTWRPRLEPSYDAEASEALLMRCAAATAFVCASLRNAAAQPEALPGGVGALIDEVVHEVALLAGTDAPPSSHDWRTIEERRRSAIESMRPTEQLDGELDSNSMSWRNLLRGMDEDGD